MVAKFRYTNRGGANEILAIEVNCFYIVVYHYLMYTQHYSIISAHLWMTRVTVMRGGGADSENVLCNIWESWQRIWTWRACCAVEALHSFITVRMRLGTFCREYGEGLGVLIRTWWVRSYSYVSAQLRATT